MQGSLHQAPCAKLRAHLLKRTNAALDSVVSEARVGHCSSSTQLDPSLQRIAPNSSTQLGPSPQRIAPYSSAVASNHSAEDMHPKQGRKAMRQSFASTSRAWYGSAPYSRSGTSQEHARWPEDVVRSDTTASSRPTPPAAGAAPGSSSPTRPAAGEPASHDETSARSEVVPDCVRIQLSTAE